MRWKYLILIITSLLILSSCAPQKLAGEEAKRIIEVKVIDQTLLYQCHSFWSAKKFPEISEDDLKARFEGKYDIDAREFEFSFNTANRSTITECHIYGAVRKGGNRYTADLLWFLNPYGLDFINDNFKESKTGLSWKGTINGVLMSIKVKCPPQDCVYKAWQYPVGHCHGHIWWTASNSEIKKNNFLYLFPCNRFITSSYQL